VTSTRQIEEARKRVSYAKNAYFNSSFRMGAKYRAAWDLAQLELSRLLVLQTTLSDPCDDWSATFTSKKAA